MPPRTLEAVQDVTMAKTETGDTSSDSGGNASQLCKQTLHCPSKKAMGPNENVKNIATSTYSGVCCSGHQPKPSAHLMVQKPWVQPQAGPRKAHAHLPSRSGRIPHVEALVVDRAGVWMHITPLANEMQSQLTPKAQHCMQTQPTAPAGGMWTQLTLKTHHCMLTQLALPVILG